MTQLPSLRNVVALPGRNRSGAVSIMFATAVIPMAISVGLAVDYGFYVQAVAQTTMAADAAAIHAVRIAVTTFNSGASASQAGTAGGQAGLQWFQAQLGSLVTGSVPVATISVFPPSSTSNCATSPCVGFTQSTGTFSTAVNYQLQVPTHFGGMVRVPVWKTNQVASAAVTANAFVEVDMILDSSASMSIGTTPDDMLKIEQLSVCMPASVAARYLATGDQADVFQYFYSGANVGYANNQFTPTPTSNAGACNPLYDGDPRLCQPTSVINTNQYAFQFGATNVDQYGFCPPGFGVLDTSTPPKTDPTYKNATANLPVPTCSLSCHDDPNYNDLAGLVNSANKYNGAGISIRLNVVTQAATEVINTLISKEQQLGLPNQFSVGVYEFNSSYGQQDYPVPGGPFVEAGTNLAQAAAITSNIQPTNNSTDLDDALKAFATYATPSGTGGTAQTPTKNIFIVTDGLQDNLRTGLPVGARWTPVTVANCNTLKAMGFNLFVLYTPYYPLPHYQYLTGGIRPMFEPAATSSVLNNLTACASKPGQFFEASSQGEINTAMQQMLNLALNQPATITH